MQANSEREYKSVIFLFDIKTLDKSIVLLRYALIEKKKNAGIGQDSSAW